MVTMPTMAQTRAISYLERDAAPQDDLPASGVYGQCPYCHRNLTAGHNCVADSVTVPPDAPQDDLPSATPTNFSNGPSQEGAVGSADDRSWIGLAQLNGIRLAAAEEENERLRAALRELLDAWGPDLPQDQVYGWATRGDAERFVNAIAAARDCLAEKR